MTKKNPHRIGEGFFNSGIIYLSVRVDFCLLLQKSYRESVSIRKFKEAEFSTRRDSFYFLLSAAFASAFTLASSKDFWQRASASSTIF